MTEMTYTKNGDYLIPDLKLSEVPETSLGKYGRMRKNINTTSTVTWSAGNFGVEGTTGKISFQSLSSYTDDANVIKGQTAKCNMSTEAKVMEQFFSSTQGNAASVTMEFDVTKIKAGDTFSIDGQTFEFTDGDRTTKAEYMAIDLSSLGISGGIPAYQKEAVMNKINT